MKKTKENKTLTKNEKEEMLNLLKTGPLPLEKEMQEYIELSTKNKLTEKEDKRKEALSRLIKRANGLYNSFWLSLISDVGNRDFLITTRNSLIEEHNCKLSLEFMLVDRIIANYFRSMKLDAFLGMLTESEGNALSIDVSKINMINELSKILESSSRQLHTSMLLFNELKGPKLNVKVNTKNAFISQNQQLNINKKDNEK
jgi:hypothetical protein